MIAKQKKLLVICTVIFAVILVLYLAVIRPLVNTEEPAQPGDPLETVEGETVSVNGRIFMYPQVERAYMQSIKVVNEHGSYEFYRDENDDFQIRGYEGTVFDGTKFATLVTNVGYTLSKVKVTDNATAAQLAEYGLDNPKAHWTLTTTDGETYTVYVGYDLLTGGGYYTMLEGRRTVYVLDEALATTVLAPIESLCTPVLVAGVPQNEYYKIDNFTIMKGDDVFVMISILDKKLQQNPEAAVEHFMRYPSGYYPNSDLLLEILYGYGALAGTHVEKLGPTAEDMKAYGLDDPAYTVYFEYGGEKIYLFFSELQGDGTYYATSSMFPLTVSVVDEASVSYLQHDLISWIAVYPFQQWITAVRKLDIVGSGADVSFTLNHGVDSSGAATLSVSADTGKEIPNSDINNFRQFYKTLLSIAIEDYTPLTDLEKAALVTEENCILTFTITMTNGTETVYRFYPYSGTGRRSLMTVNGHGEFYVLTDLVVKIASDANKVLYDLDVDSYGKN